MGTETTSNGQETSIDYESDSLRFLFETYLAEYDSTRRQIELNLQLAERSIDYFLTLVAALILALQVLTESSNQVMYALDNNPFVYLILASMSLWFPFENLSKNAHIAVLGKYEFHVLVPKLDEIAAHLSGNSNATREFLRWEAFVFPSWLRGTMRWEAYRAKVEGGNTVTLFSAVASLRYIVLCAPSVLFVVAFISTKGAIWISWSQLERITAIVFLVFFVSLLIGFFQTSRSFVSVKQKLRQ